MQEDELNFVNDTTAHYAFEDRILPNWSKMSESYPYVAEVPMRVLLMFPSTYLCEQRLSAMFCM